jgi:hypothetical protein
VNSEKREFCDSRFSIQACSKKLMLVETNDNAEICNLIGFSSFKELCPDSQCLICLRIIDKFALLAQLPDVELNPCVNILTKLTDNISQFPTEQKYKSFRAANPNIKRYTYE